MRYHATISGNSFSADRIKTVLDYDQFSNKYPVEIIDSQDAKGTGFYMKVWNDLVGEMETIGPYSTKTECVEAKSEYYEFNTQNSEEYFDPDEQRLEH